MSPKSLQFQASPGFAAFRDGRVLARGALRRLRWLVFGGLVGGASACAPAAQHPAPTSWCLTQDAYQARLDLSADTAVVTTTDVALGGTYDGDTVTLPGQQPLELRRVGDELLVGDDAYHACGEGDLEPDPVFAALAGTALCGDEVWSFNADGAVERGDEVGRWRVQGITVVVEFGGDQDAYVVSLGSDGSVRVWGDEFAVEGCDG